MLKDPSAAEKRPRGSVLLADGSQHGLTARGMILREQGYAVETSSTGDEAWSLIESRHFDVVVASYRLKGLTGPELITRLHEAGYPARSVLLLTHTESLSLDASKLGADETVAKGSREVAELLRAVQRLAESKPRRRTVSRQRGSSPKRRSRGESAGA